jgi:hypothetical protein
MSRSILSSAFLRRKRDLLDLLDLQIAAGLIAPIAFIDLLAPIRQNVGDECRAALPPVAAICPAYAPTEPLPG